MTGRLRFIALIVGCSAVSALSLVAFAGTSTTLRMIHSILHGTAVGATCTVDSQCVGLVDGNNDSAGGWCFKGACCSFTACKNTNDCCGNITEPANLQCIQQYGAGNPTSCCAKNGGSCQSDGFCCDSYYWGALVGIVNSSTAQACVNNACQHCGIDGTTATAHTPRTAPYSVNATVCCTGWEANINNHAGTNVAKCCSNLGQACGGTVNNANPAYCCGSPQDPTLGSAAPELECSPITNHCCIGTNDTVLTCTQNSDCCSNWCNSGHCQDGACSL